MNTKGQRSRTSKHTTSGRSALRSRMSNAHCWALIRWRLLYTALVFVLTLLPSGLRLKRK